MKKLLITIIALFSLNIQAANDATFAVNGEKIYSPTLAGCFLIYMIAPDRLAGWSGSLKQHELEYLPEKYQKLPMLGGWWKSEPINKDLIAKHKITKAFLLGTPKKLTSHVDELKGMGMDILILDADFIEDYIALYEELGRQMGLTARGKELAAFGREMIDKTRAMVKDIPDSEKKSVYAGSGPKGLSAMCYMDAMEIAGGKNAVTCPEGTNPHSEQSMTLEQVKALNADVMLITNPAGAQVMKDPAWLDLPAYKEKRLIVVPHGPLGWLHHFTPYTRFIGAPWLAATLYPEKCNIDITKEAKRYYKLFFGITLSDKQLKQIMYKYN